MTTPAGCGLKRRSHSEAIARVRRGLVRARRQPGAGAGARHLQRRQSGAGQRPPGRRLSAVRQEQRLAHGAAAAVVLPEPGFRLPWAGCRASTSTTTPSRRCAWPPISAARSPPRARTSRSTSRLGAALGVETADGFTLLSVGPTAAVSRELDAAKQWEAYGGASILMSRSEIDGGRDTDTSLPLRFGLQYSPNPDIRNPVRDAVRRERRDQRRLLVHGRGAVPVLTGVRPGRIPVAPPACHGRRIAASLGLEVPMPMVAARRLALARPAFARGSSDPCLCVGTAARAARWVELAPADTTRPPSRATHGVVLDAPGRRLIAWGERIPKRRTLGAGARWARPLDAHPGRGRLASGPRRRRPPSWIAAGAALVTFGGGIGLGHLPTSNEVWVPRLTARRAGSDWLPPASRPIRASNTARSTIPRAIACSCSAACPPPVRRTPRTRTRSGSFRSATHPRGARSLRAGLLRRLASARAWWSTRRATEYSSSEATARSPYVHDAQE